MYTKEVSMGGENRVNRYGDRQTMSKDWTNRTRGRVFTVGERQAAVVQEVISEPQ